MDVVTVLSTGMWLAGMVVLALMAVLPLLERLGDRR